ncbi:MAG: TMEM198/TM7SF3 family protein, partial [Candidatus Hydrogenedentes bacterium]|nr:TMEM198/TM7SF3 family protein [Candidatus Hydrogenedentota bacterium]
MNELLSWRLEDVPPEHATLVLAGFAVVGTLYCFLGYRLLKFILGLTGFLLAGSAAAFIVGFLSYGNVIGMGIGLLIGGICGAMALFFLYKTGIFCVGMLGATLVAYNLLHTRPEVWILWAVAGVGLVGGLLAILIEKPIMTLATAAIGAMMITQSGLVVAREQGLFDSLHNQATEVTSQL